MYTVFVLCHEGEIPYVLAGLREAVEISTTPLHVIDHGSTEKMHMGYALLQGESEPSTALLTELCANPEIYLYTIQQSGTTVEGSAQVEDVPTHEPEWWEIPIAPQL